MNHGVEFIPKYRITNCQPIVDLTGGVGLMELEGYIQTTEDFSISAGAGGPFGLLGKQVVIGAARPLGRTLLELLGGETQDVRAVVLDPSAGSNFPSSVEAVYADALKAGSVADACKGASVIYDCFEPSPSMRDRVMPEVTFNVLLAAIDSGATLIFASHLLASESDNDKLEGDVLHAHGSKLTRTLVARVPQLYGPRVVNQLWQNVFESAIRGKKAHWMGNLDVERSYLFVEDAARVMILLAKSLWAHGRAWNIAGPGPLTGRQFTEHAFKAAGREPSIGFWGRGVVLTGSIIDQGSKRFLQLPYDYYSPFVLDGSAFSEAFPSTMYTEHAIAIARTLEWFKLSGGKGTSKDAWNTTV